MTFTPTIPRHRILREVIRNYTVFESLCSQSGRFSVTHKGLVVSFHDLQGCLKRLSPRKKEAVFYHVILDWKQKDVAAEMGITTVSVGQYVEQAMLQIAKEIWPEEYKRDEEEA